MGSHELKDIMNYVYYVDTHFLLNIDILQDVIKATYNAI